MVSKSIFRQIVISPFAGLFGIVYRYEKRVTLSTLGKAGEQERLSPTVERPKVNLCSGLGEYSGMGKFPGDGMYVVSVYHFRLLSKVNTERTCLTFLIYQLPLEIHPKSAMLAYDRS